MRKKLYCTFKWARQTKGRGGWTFFWRLTFYALQHTKIWSNSERTSHKSDWKVKILPIYITCCASSFTFLCSPLQSGATCNCRYRYMKELMTKELHSKNKKAVLTLTKGKFYHATRATYSQVISASDRSRFYSDVKSNSDKWFTYAIRLNYEPRIV